MKSEDLEGGLPAIKEKMVEGRVNKMFKEKILLDQVHQGRLHDGRGLRRELRRRFGALNIQVARFGTFRLGETASLD